MMVYTHLAAALVAAALASAGTYKVQEWRYGAKEADRLAQVAELAKMNAKAADSAAAGHEADKAKTRVQFRTIYQEVDRVVQNVVYRNTCLDDAGLQLVASAIGTVPASSVTTSTLSTLKPPDGWLGRIRAAVGAANNRELSGVQEQTPAAR